ncbi:CRISPR-associated protein Csx11 [Spirulina subsalsa FACHB-351]|uniref:CRISPR-associated protein Csx11 n=1 Tax=Spirulina subsalsa FACHB-351 TaxID=234711 RepID=A0ABT3KZT0_9CYAN|nr:CRISPR-associated protein Csx11 [Spirulina subsalsa]MCW6034763.1 CRISPR-associated protein Csx11 [Spirulina subsalsa FACHB-351]
MNQLDILVNNRDAILLAEAIGWLHDYRKCSDEQLKVQAANLSGQNGLSWDQLSNHFPTLNSININLIGDSCQFIRLIHKKSDTSCNYLPNYLSRCHNTAHFDKQEPHGGEQNYPGVTISSPFGFEQDIPNDLTNQLWSLPWIKLASYSQSERQNFIKKVSELFIQVGADTRRPINEISLWDWGTLVGALYKAAIAGALLSGNTAQAQNLRWRLLTIQVNGLDFITKVSRLPDLLSRKELLKNSFNNVRNLLEIEYSLGNEVYRDESRSIFVVYDLPDLLNSTNQRNEKIRDLILQEFKQGTLKNDPSLKLGGELKPIIELDHNSWWGQDPDYQSKQQAGQLPQDEIPPIGQILKKSIVSPLLPEEIKQFWPQNGIDQYKAADVCTVCGMRPQGNSQKLVSRKVCDICERRRLDRSQLWATQQAEDTIWIDEVADTNARLALIIGQFNLEDWLSGQLVESLILNPPSSGVTTSVKNPSFSRIRRIWETTRRFWIEIRKDFNQLLSDSRRRLIFYLDKMPTNLGLFHVYELDLGNVKLSVAWYPPQPDRTGGYLISTDNLSYTARQLQAKREIFADPATGAIFVEDYIQSQFVNGNRSIVLRDSDANQRNQNLLVDRRIIKTEHQDIAYSTAIPILTEPSNFMALVPAEKSLDVVKAIKTKYEIEMGKVRNRLPLHLGVVYFNRRTPLRSALDAGRQMLSYKSDSQKTWKVHSISKGQLPSEKQELANGTQQFTETITLELTQDNYKITWHVPNKMGDGTTPDNWYPYVFLKTSDDSEVDGRIRKIKSQRPGTTEPCWLVHAGDLQQDDKIYFTSSTFDFEYLDSTARRFEIHYDKKTGRRPRPTRPFYLEDLDRLQTLWDMLKKLQTSQRHQVIHTIEATREKWHGDKLEPSWTDDTFKQFVKDTLANAAWPKDQPWVSFSESERQQLIDAGVRGELADIADLYMEILKER